VIKLNLAMHNNGAATFRAIKRAVDHAALEGFRELI
jgi:hypothetical protein